MTSTSARDMEAREPKAKRNQVPDGRSEKAIQSACVKMLKKQMGFRVWNLSQARRTKQSPGLPDNWIAGHGVTAWVEFKTQIGAQTLDQWKFEQACIANGCTYLLVRCENDLIKWAEPIINRRKQNPGNAVDVERLVEMIRNA